MRVKGKRILKNGVVAGYVLQKDGTWKWRFIKGPSKKKGGVNNNELNNNGRLIKLKNKYGTNRKEENTELRKKLKNLSKSLKQKHLSSPKVFGKHDNRVYKQMYKNLDAMLHGSKSDGNIIRDFLTKGRRNRIQRSINKWTKKKAKCETKRCEKQRTASKLLQNDLIKINDIKNNISITNERRTPNVNISKKLNTNNNRNSKTYFENPYITMDNIKESQNIMRKLLTKIYNIVVSLPECELDRNGRHYKDIGIGDESEIKDSILNIFCFDGEETKTIHKGFESVKRNNKNINKGITFMMRHSIRSDQVCKNNFYIKDCSANKLCSIFYPETRGWREEPILTKLGIYLAFAEGIRLCRSGIKIDRIVSSPYIRCIQTAIFVAIATGIKEIFIDGNLGENMQSNLINLNFYKKCPEEGHYIEFFDIKIISDGIKKAKNYERMKQINSILEYNKNSKENILHVCHDSSLGRNYSCYTYGWIVGFKNSNKNLYYNLRGIYNSEIVMGRY